MVELKIDDRRKSNEFREKCRKNRLGKHLSETTRRKLSETMKNKIQEGYIPKNIFSEGHKIKEHNLKEDDKVVVREK